MNSFSLLHISQVTFSIFLTTLTEWSRRIQSIKTKIDGDTKSLTHSDKRPVRWLTRRHRNNLPCTPRSWFSRRNATRWQSVWRGSLRNRNLHLSGRKRESRWSIPRSRIWTCVPCCKQVLFYSLPLSGHKVTYLPSRPHRVWKNNPLQSRSGKSWPGRNWTTRNNRE